MIELRGDWVLVKPIVKDRTEGGILLPDSAKEGSMLAKVVAVGPGRKREQLYVSDDVVQGSGAEGLDGKRIVRRRFIRVPVEVPVGAVVVIPRWAGYEVKIDGEQYLLVREYQCLAVVEDDE